MGVVTKLPVVFELFTASMAGAYWACSLNTGEGVLRWKAPGHR
jgi:hypothetical protein